MSQLLVLNKVVTKLNTIINYIKDWKQNSTLNNTRTNQETKRLIKLIKIDYNCLVDTTQNCVCVFLNKKKKNKTNSNLWTIQQSKQTVVRRNIARVPCHNNIKLSFLSFCFSVQNSKVEVANSLTFQLNV